MIFKLYNMKKELKQFLILYVPICLLILFFTLLFLSHRIVKCSYNQDILANESEGQIILNNLITELKENIILLEKNNTSFSITDKVNITNHFVHAYIAWINEITGKGFRCYSSFFTKYSPQDNWETFFCLRRNYGPHANFTALQRCGSCGEYANLNKALLEGIGVKTRTIGAYGGGHSWNEVFINGEWIDVDATTFSFNDTSYYKDKMNLDLFWVRVLEGNDTGLDLTNKYNPKISFMEKIKKVGAKTLIQIDKFFKSIVKMMFF